MVKRLLMPAPIEIQPPRMSIDFDSDAKFGACLQDFVDVDLVSWTSLQLAAGHMSQDGRVRICDRFENAVRLLLFRPS